ncbi:MAG: hypothetical protein WAM14_12250 [Candidatus Nitrosopolaris sp.]
MRRHSTDTSVSEKRRFENSRTSSIRKHEVGKIRTRNRDFPTVLLRLDEKDEFLQILGKDSNTVKRILECVSNNALKVFV